ncbi:MAG: GspE/PulE family protein [Desulfotalea sp.]
MAKNAGIIDSLITSGRINEKQVRHAQRIADKLSTPKPLVNILKELGVLDDDTVNATIRETGLSIKIGNLLAELGHVTKDDLDFAYAAQKSSDTGSKLGSILVRYNFITRSLFNQILSIQLGYQTCEPSMGIIDKEIVGKVPIRIIEERQFIPIELTDGTKLVAFGDPLDQSSLNLAKKYLGSNWKPAIADPDIVKETIKFLVIELTGKSIDVNTSTIIGLANSIIMKAIENDASDVHIEPMADRLQIRFREDGVLRHYKDFPADLIAPLTSRYKVMAKADIAERRRHQDGRILFETNEGPIDLRVSFYVTVFGQKIVLRILKQKQHLLDIRSIGIMPNVLKRFLEEVLYQSTGVLLVTGPTGSGKTSTVYSCINHIKSPNTSIITAEEPVEYIMEGISQCSIDPSIDLTFAETLRHIVRQDPDIIVIGEIRDQESAEMAMQSALTGHKVLSTFHTEDSIGGLVRLLNMDIAPFLISSTVVSVLAQRLLRKICLHCKQEVAVTAEELRRLRANNETIMGEKFHKGRGCSKCKQTGYKGRIGVFELLVLDEEVRNAIIDKKTSHEIRELSINYSGLMTLLEDGLLKAADGITSISELLRCLPNLTAPRQISELRRLSGD